MKKALLVVSFGTSVAETREKTIGAIEKALADAFPDRKFYRAWTSKIIIKKLARTTGEHIDNVPQALEKMAADGVTDVLIQPTHFTEGIEYDRMQEDIRSTLQTNSSPFEKVMVGRPLLSSDKDLEDVASALQQIFSWVEPEDALILMGHGSDHPMTRVYGEMGDLFHRNHRNNWFMGTVEAVPGLEQISSWLEGLPSRPRTVYLSPFMLVAGDHAVNDMAGDTDDSWKSVLTQKGYHVDCILKGMGEYPEIRAIYIQHANNAQLMKAE